MKDHPDPLSIKVSSRLYYHFKKEFNKILPKQRIWVMEEYIDNANPRLVLDKPPKQSKLVSKGKTKLGKEKLKLKKLEEKLKKSKKCPRT